EPAGPPAPLRQHVTASPPPEHGESSVPAHLEPSLPPWPRLCPARSRLARHRLDGLSNPSPRRTHDDAAPTRDPPLLPRRGKIARLPQALDPTPHKSTFPFHCHSLSKHQLGLPLSF